MQVNGALVQKYTIRTESVENAPGCWNSLRCEVLMDEDKIGEYVYNYSSGAPFHPFEKNGKHYALYSRDYTSTRVMSLPDCKDIGGEERHAFGFCPTGYAVPFGEYYERVGEVYEGRQFNAEFGFVCGCVWGDDNSWKIQILNLTRVEDGIIDRDEEALGYIELLGEASSLADAIDVDGWTPEDPIIRVTGARSFRLPESIVPTGKLR